MVVYVVVRAEPVSVKVRFGIYEHTVKGVTILDVLIAAPFPGFQSVGGARAYGEDGGERAFTVCDQDRRLVAGETIELVRDHHRQLRPR